MSEHEDPDLRFVAGKRSDNSWIDLHAFIDAATMRRETMVAILDSLAEIAPLKAPMEPDGPVMLIIDDVRSERVLEMEAMRAGQRLGLIVVAELSETNRPSLERIAHILAADAFIVSAHAPVDRGEIVEAETKSPHMAPKPWPTPMKRKRMPMSPAEMRRRAMEHTRRGR
jgi:hypothetical protein